MLRATLVVSLGLVMGSAAGEAQKAAPAPFPLEQMATCKDSWLDWKDDPVSTASHGESFRAQFRPGDNGASFVPIASTTVMGLPVSEVYPTIVGMGVGFSVQVKAPFDRARKAIEQSLGKPLQKCETSDGMQTCGLEVGEKKTVMMVADADGKSGLTLIGCYYYYEK